MFRNFSGQTANDTWLAIADAFRNDDHSGINSPAAQPSRAGHTRELLHATLSIAEPRQRWVTVREPALNPAFALAEVIWILSGRNDSRFLTYFNRQLPRFAGEGPTFHGAYGFRLRHQMGVDQLERAYLALKANPDSRQVVLQIWDCRADLPLIDGSASAADIPCNLASMLKVRDGLLEWAQVLRSNDIYRGLPYNVIQFTSLQEIMAGWLGVDVGSYNHVSDSLHVYVSDLPGLHATRRSDTSCNNDDLRLEKEESESVIAELMNAASRVTDENVTASALVKNATGSRLPRAYRSMLLVLTAEGIRRRGESRVAMELMDECGNPVLKEMVARWTARLAKPVSRD